MTTVIMIIKKEKAVKGNFIFQKEESSTHKRQKPQLISFVDV